MRLILRASLIFLLLYVTAVAGCSSGGDGIVFDPDDQTPRHLNFTPQHVEIKGDYAFIASKINGVNVFDITDRLNPDWVANVKTPGIVLDIFIEGDYAYVADGEEGLQILDISSPEDAEIAYHVEIPGVSNGVTVRNGYAYIAAGEFGLQIVDVEPLDMAYVVREVLTESEALNVKVYRNEAYIGCTQGLYIADIENPEKALLINTNLAKESFGEFDIRGDYAYFAHKDGLDLIYLKRPQWAYVKSFIEPWDDETEDARRAFLSLSWRQIKKDDQRPEDEKKGKVKAFTSVACYGNYVIAGGYNRVLHIIDVSDPKKPRLVHKIMGYAPAQSITISGHYAWVAEPDVGMVVVDLSNPRNARIATIVATPRPQDIDAAKGYAYLAADELGLQIIDTDPIESSYLVKTLDTGGLVSQVKYRDGFVYAIDYGKGLQIIDVTDPVNAEIVNTVKVPGVPWWVDVNGDMAYVVSRAGGLYLVDIDPPEMASVVSEVKLPDMKYNVVCAYVDDHVYLMGCKKRLQVAQIGEVGSSILNIIDVSDRENPWIKNALGMDVRAEYLDQAGDYLYVTDTKDNLVMIDINPPELSKVMKTVRLDKHVSGDTEFAEGYTLSGIWGGMVIVDVEPAILAHVFNSISTASNVKSLDIEDNYAYIGDIESGFRIVKLWDLLDEGKG